MYDTDVSMQSSRRFPMVLRHAIIFYFPKPEKEASHHDTIYRRFFC